MISLKPHLPEGYLLRISNDLTRFIKDSTDELVFTIFLSTVLSLVVGPAAYSLLSRIEGVRPDRTMK